MLIKEKCSDLSFADTQAMKNEDLMKSAKES
jgi:hypothetical protein